MIFWLSLPFCLAQTYPPRFLPVPEDTQITSLYNLQNVPDIPVALPLNNMGPNNCIGVAPTSCNWSCGNCLGPGDFNMCFQGNHFALTFDDGPTPYTTQLLAMLAQSNIKATFFVIGGQVVEYPDIARAIVNQGHEIGVHTWSHTGLTTMATGSIVAELHYTIQAIQSVTGIRPRYFRPPFGDHDDRVRAVATAMGLVNVMWSLDSGDFRMDTYSATDPTPFVAPITAAINSQTPSGLGHILLQHDTSASRVAIVPAILESLRVAGLTPVTVSQCINQLPAPIVTSSAIVTTTSVRRTSTRTTTTASRPASTISYTFPIASSALKESWLISLLLSLVL